MKKFNGSMGWLVFWAIFCFPAAIVYWCMRQEEVKNNPK